MNEPTAGSGSVHDGVHAGSPAMAVDSIESLQSLIQQSPKILVVGRQTKPTLSVVDAETTRVTTDALSGIIEYEPSEFTFTALAGTTMREIEETLRQRNQYLPFDPVLVQAGATLGGTVAAGTSGPGRHRFGGVRDFILGADFIDGEGTLIHSGGKVVKNAAGFDIPKLLVGSCGRLAVMTALTFKVFPLPVDRHTFVIPCDNHQQASTRIAAIARGRWELDAIDYQAATRTIWIRIGADQGVSEAIVSDIAHTIDVSLPLRRTDQAGQFWQSLRELRFGRPEQTCVLKLPLTLRQMRALSQWCDGFADGVTLHVSVAGALGWLAIEERRLADLEGFLVESQMTGLVLRGGTTAPHRCLIGSRTTAPIETAVKVAMDPPGRFPSLPN